MIQRLHIAIACGGTGGHIFPGVSVGEALLREGHHVTLWMAGKEGEEKALSEWSADCVTMPIRSVSWKNPAHAIRSMYSLIKGFVFVFKRFSAECPDVLLAMGSYSSVPPVLAARCLKIPYVLHEANVIPGRAVSFLAKQAACVALTFEQSRTHFPKNVQLVTTGLPLRADIKDERLKPAVPRSIFTLLVVGGSRGARRLNEIVPEALSAWNKPIEVHHVAGVYDHEAVSHLYAEKGVHAMVYDFVHQMGDLYKKADLVICRAGASTCMEVSVFGKPALYIPYPYAIRDHQKANAAVLVEYGAADLIDERELDVSRLVDYLEAQWNNRSRLEHMGQAARAFSREHAEEDVIEILEQVGSDAG